MSEIPAATELQVLPERTRVRTASIVVAVVALLVLVVGVGGMVATSTVGCSACHAAEADAFAASAHAAIPCADCHATSPRQVSARMDVLVRMLPRSLGGVKLDGAGRPVGDRACLDCHADIPTGDPVERNGLRIDHAVCAVDAACASCHSTASHGTVTRMVRAPVMSECTACHLENDGPTACDTCHEDEGFAGDHVRDPVWVRTHGSDWEDAHGLGDLRTCGMCHPADDCSECHGSGVPHPADFGGTHGSYAIKTGRDKCLTCHKKAAFCEGCHQIEMPHPDGFLQEHSGVASSQDDPACTRCHPPEDCRTCHGYHVHPGGAVPSIVEGGVG